MYTHGKFYKTEESLIKSFGVFLANKAFINAHNRGAFNFTMGLN